MIEIFAQNHEVDFMENDTLDCGLAFSLVTEGWWYIVLAWHTYILEKKSGFEISRHGSAKFVIPLKFTIFIIRFCIRKLKTPFLKGLFDIFKVTTENHTNGITYTYAHTSTYMT